MKEELKRIYSSLTERLKSPFILTFLVVWIIRHWEVVYLVFNFGDDCNANCRLAIIKEKLEKENLKEIFLIPLLFSGISFVLYLIISLVYEYIYLLYSKWGRTFVEYFSKNNKFVSEKVHSELITKYENLNELKLKFERELEQIKLVSQDNESQKKALFQPIFYYFSLFTFHEKLFIKHFPEKLLTTIPAFLKIDWKVCETGNPKSINDGLTRYFTFLNNGLANIEKKEILGDMVDFRYDSENGLIFFEIINSTDEFLGIYNFIIVNSFELICIRSYKESILFSNWKKYSL